MTAPLFYAAGLDRTIGPGGEVVLDGSEAVHAIRSMRLRRSDALSIADGDGFVAHGHVESITGDTLTMTAETLHTEPEPAMRLTLVQALAKGDRDLQAIEAATEIGVDRVVPWQSERSIVVWRSDRATKGLRKWRSTLTAAGKQSRRARLPELDGVTSTTALASAIEQTRDDVIAVVLDADSTDMLATVGRGAAGRTPVTVMLFAGPEGGISPGERDMLLAAGARTARIGSGVLRASTAGPVGLSVVRTAADTWETP